MLIKQARHTLTSTHFPRARSIGVRSFSSSDAVEVLRWQLQQASDPKNRANNPNNRGEGATKLAEATGKEGAKEGEQAAFIARMLVLVHALLAAEELQGGGTSAAIKRRHQHLLGYIAISI